MFSLLMIERNSISKNRFNCSPLPSNQLRNCISTSKESIFNPVSNSFSSSSLTLEFGKKSAIVEELINLPTSDAVHISTHCQY